MNTSRLATGSYSNTIRDIIRRERERKGIDNINDRDKSEPRYFSLKLPWDDRMMFLELRNALTLQAGGNLSNVEVCKIAVELAHKIVVEDGRS